MNVGYFYFIKNNFYEDFPELNLMKNHETTRNTEHNRPCFYAIQQDNNIMWLIPISSKVEKYKKIMKNKISKYGKCYTIEFANVLGRERAFLIQNMFPIISDYIYKQYLDYNNTSVEINNLSKKRIINKSKKALNLQKEGRHIIFGDVLQAERKLLNMLSEKTLVTI